MASIDRVGFLVHEPNLWAHYSSVWEELDRDRFAVVLTERFRETDGPGSLGVRDFLRKLEAKNYRVDWAVELRERVVKYTCIVSNHKISGSSLQPTPAWRRLLSSTKKSIKSGSRFHSDPIDARQYLPLQLGERQVRFMYGADIGDGWSLADWNRIYDLFLCHGPNDEEQISRRFRGRTFQMGYPRYDGYFDPALDVSAIADEFAIDTAKRTVLWMPTFGEHACSIPHFAEELAKLKDDYNFIVRPHPISFSRKPEDIERLRSSGFQIDGDPLRDMNCLYRVVDAVVCDYGGSPFGALYLGKRVVLLDVPGSSDWYTVKGTSNFELRECMPTFDVSNVKQLGACFARDDFWEQRHAREDKLRNKYFANFRGTSSKRAAEALMKVDEMIGHVRDE
jgi:hypothetical protein